MGGPCCQRKERNSKINLAQIENNAMNRTLYALILVGPVLMLSCGAHAEQVGKSDAISDLNKSFYKADQKEDAAKVEHLEDVSGMDWFELSLGERMDHILASMSILSHQGVPIKKSMNDYYNAVSEKLRTDPSLYETKITNILASIIYEKDPESRAKIDQFRNKPA